MINPRRTAAATRLEANVHTNQEAVAQSVGPWGTHGSGQTIPDVMERAAGTQTGGGIKHRFDAAFRGARRISIPMERGLFHSGLGSRRARVGSQKPTSETLESV